MLWALLVFAVLLPLIMLGFGTLMKFRPPRKINWVFGYRTALSMRNQATWDFAHRHCGGVWRRVGAALLPPSLVLFLLMAHFGQAEMGTVALVLLQLGCLIGSVFPTEAALRKNFDKDGTPKPQGEVEP